MKIQSLEEFEANNTDADAEEAEAAVIDNDDETGSVDIDDADEVTEDEEGSAEEGDESEGEEATEAWLEEQEGSEDDLPLEFTRRDVAAAKTKLRAKHQRQEDKLLARVDQLEQQIKSGNHSPVQESVVPNVGPRPREEDYDTYEAFEQDLDDWFDKKVDEKIQSSQKQAAVKQQQAKAQQELEQSVNSHLQRVQALIKEHSINPELYESADYNIRQAAELASPGQGNFIVDQFIARLGEGSEKVIMFVGRNPSALAELQSRLLQDPSGLSASLYLGEIRATKAMPAKINSKAPKPARRIKGDKSGNPEASVAKLQKRLEKAYKENDLQAAVDIEFEAEERGITLKS